MAPERKPARPDPARRWAMVEVDEEAGVIRRPAGVRFDSGGIGKGLAADLIAERLEGQTRYVIGCGGDLRVGGTLPERQEVLVEHPITGAQDRRLYIENGAVASSGINIRVWRREDGRYAHHLIDPRTGEPAWTGLVGATALAPTGVEAETTAKAALLSGPDGARELLREHGGVIFHEDGEAEPVGPIELKPRLTVRVPAGMLKEVAA
jgi:thiamine biosynthesis lipoprotein